MSARAERSLPHGAVNARRSISAASARRRARSGRVRTVDDAARSGLGRASSRVSSSASRSIVSKPDVDERARSTRGTTRRCGSLPATAGPRLAIHDVDVAARGHHLVVEQHEVGDVGLVRPATEAPSHRTFDTCRPPSRRRYSSAAPAHLRRSPSFHVCDKKSATRSTILCRKREWSAVRESRE